MKTNGKSTVQQLIELEDAIRAEHGDGRLTELVESYVSILAEPENFRAWFAHRFGERSAA